MSPDFDVQPAGDVPPQRGPDRRAGTTPRFSKYTFTGGRRGNFRRGGEGVEAFVDVYPTRLLVLLIWIAVMNLLDSFFTLVHLQAGGIELNPFAAILLETGRVGFVVWKAVLIGGAILVLCIHKNFVIAKAGLFLAASAYTLLVLYHLSLFRV
ncbi:MAG: hypothetical protein ACJAZ8_001485 [Planctomycetota bacterium]|jgi:hypothetical protein